MTIGGKGQFFLVGFMMECVPMRSSSKMGTVLLSQEKLVEILVLQHDVLSMG